MNDTVLQSSKEIIKSMDKCTKCGICNAYCPVSGVTNVFPGPKYTGPQTQRYRSIELLNEISPDLCNGCGICMSVCPNDVAITDIITIAKSNLNNKNKKIPLLQKMLNRPEKIGRLGNIFPIVSNFFLKNSLFRLILENFISLSSKAPLPTFSGNKLNKFIVKNVSKHNKNILYFTGCAVDNYDQNIGINTIKLMNFLGYNVDIISGLCCSLPMLSSGEWDSAIVRSKKLINLLDKRLNDTNNIIFTSTSCSLTIKKKYAAYLDFTDNKSLDISKSSYDICEYILENHYNDLINRLKPINKKIFYHGPCQLRSHGMGQPAVKLLRLIPNISLILSEADCCGIGGTFGYSKKNNNISNDISKTLLNQVVLENPDIVICDSETCRWHIEKLSNVKTLHPVDVLTKSLNL